MLTFLGDRNDRYCDGVSRRDFLKVGALGIGGLTLADLLQAEAAAGEQARKKNFINIYLPGGPTHMDTFDLKPQAPKEYRGEFKPIATNATGLEICEMMTELATVGDKFSVVRSISGMNNEHSGVQSDTGWSIRSLKELGGRPSLTSVVSKLDGPSQRTAKGVAPTAVDLTGWTKPGFLGQVHAGYRPDGTGRANLKLHSSVSLDRLSDRRSLLSGFNRMQRGVDQSGMMDALDSFSGRAMNIVTSGELYKALDTRNEDPRNIDRYGINSDRSKNRYMRSNERFLVARRLIDAGVRCVSLSWGGWDTHGRNFDIMRTQLPALSKGLTALIEDLDARGQLDDTIIMMSGEFGRTPRINGNAGRDHWPRAAFFFLAGGGMRHGQAIGATNRLGEEPQDRPVHIQHVFHTVYHQMGIDTNTTQLIDPNGRPQYLVDERELIRELV